MVCWLDCCDGGAFKDTQLRNNMWKSGENYTQLPCNYYIMYTGANPVTQYVKEKKKTNKNERIELSQGYTTLSIYGWSAREIKFFLYDPLIYYLVGSINVFLMKVLCDELSGHSSNII